LAQSAVFVFTCAKKHLSILCVINKSFSLGQVPKGPLAQSAVIYFNLLPLDKSQRALWHRVREFILIYFPWTSPKGPFGTECGDLKVEDQREEDILNKIFCQIKTGKLKTGKSKTGKLKTCTLKKNNQIKNMHIKKNNQIKNM
jgi:hypothetical protein